MIANKMFKDIVKMEAHIGVKKEMVTILRDISSTPHTLTYDGMPKNSNKSGTSIADTVIKYISLEEEIQADELRLEEKKVYILSRIGELENIEYQKILIRRYFDNKPWCDIAEELFYSISWVYKLHGFALKKLDEQIYKDKK